MPPDEPYIAKLLNATQKNFLSAGSLFKKLINPKNVSKLLKKMSVTRGGFSIDGLQVAALSSLDLKNVIIATDRTDIIIAHAKAVEEEVYYCPAGQWFSRICEEDLILELENP